MIVKIHKDQEGKEIAAVCDEDLLGKKFEEGNRQLDLTSNFYKGEVKSEDEIGDIMRNAYIVNLVGEKTIALALKEEVIEKGHIIKIAGIPHAQAVCGDR